MIKFATIYTHKMSVVKRNFKYYTVVEQKVEKTDKQKADEQKIKVRKLIEQRVFRESGYIELPKHIAVKKAIINVQNDDDKSFKYSVLSALHYNDINNNPERVTKYKPYLDELNFDGIKFPVTIRSIDKFEKQNPQSINVFVIKDNGKIDLLINSKKDSQNAIDLLLLTEGRNRHYCWIKNLSALLSRQINVNSRKKYFCKECFKHFGSQEILDRHIAKRSKIHFK